MSGRNEGRAAAVLALALAAGLAAASGAEAAKSRPAGAREATQQAGPAQQVEKKSAGTDTSLTLRGGQEGTVLGSLTVEGEDRIHVEFERPPLELTLDPTQAPGLEWGTARDVLERSTPDLFAPMLQIQAREGSPYLGRPWLAGYATGAVARFRPAVENVESWKLFVADARGRNVATFHGRGKPPAQIPWDGTVTGGSTATPGLTYSYAFQAMDKAGNARTIVGEGFRVHAWHSVGAAGERFAFAGADLPPARPAADNELYAQPALVAEAASWLNQGPARPVRVTASARNREQAQALADRVSRGLTLLTLGDPARILAQAVVEADAPEGGVVRIESGTLK